MSHRLARTKVGCHQITQCRQGYGAFTDYVDSIIRITGFVKSKRMSTISHHPQRSTLFRGPRTRSLMDLNEPHSSESRFPTLESFDAYITSSFEIQQPDPSTKSHSPSPSQTRNVSHFSMYFLHTSFIPLLPIFTPEVYLVR